MSTDAEQLLAAGKPITFKDGSVHRIVYDFLAFYYLQGAIGGLQGALAAFGIGVDSEELERVVVFEPVAKVIACGLAYELVTGKGNAKHLPDFDEVMAWVVLNLDHTQLDDYTAAAFGALIEAIPRQSEADEEADEESADPTPAAPAATNGSSPGVTSTTGQRSDFTVVMTPSGV